MTIRIRNLQFAYPSGGFELHVEALDIARGETVALVGPSGCGKTTVLHLVAGITVPDAGSVEVDDKLVSALDEAARSAFRARHIGPVFQEFELLEYLTVLENLLLPYRIAPGSLAAGLRRPASAPGRWPARSGWAARLAPALRAGCARASASAWPVGRALRRRAGASCSPTSPPATSTRPRAPSACSTCCSTHANRHGCATLVTVTHDHALLPRFDRVLEMGDLVRPGSPA